MAKYNIEFSCGHTEQKELFGKRNIRQEKIAYYEKKGICTRCSTEQREIEHSINCDEMEMHYRTYKTDYASCRTKSGSYNGFTKNIIVYIPKKVEPTPTDTLYCMECGEEVSSESVGWCAECFKKLNTGGTN